MSAWFGRHSHFMLDSPPIQGSYVISVQISIYYLNLFTFHECASFSTADPTATRSCYTSDTLQTSRKNVPPAHSETRREELKLLCEWTSPEAMSSWELWSTLNLDIITILTQAMRSRSDNLNLTTTQITTFSPRVPVLQHNSM